MMRIVPCDRRSVGAWVALRRELWPETALPDRRRDAEAILDNPEQAAAFLARDVEGAALASAEAALHQVHVNGCATAPAAFQSGLHVRPASRRQGIARLLCQTVEARAIGRECREPASGADIRNGISQTMHRAVGCEETERVVYCRKPLPAG